MQAFFDVFWQTIKALQGQGFKVVVEVDRLSEPLKLGGLIFTYKLFVGNWVNIHVGSFQDGFAYINLLDRYFKIDPETLAWLCVVITEMPAEVRKMVFKRKVSIAPTLNREVKLTMMGGQRAYYLRSTCGVLLEKFNEMLADKFLFGDDFLAVNV